MKLKSHHHAAVPRGCRFASRRTAAPRWVRSRPLLAALVAFAASVAPAAQGILGSKHDLSAGGPGPIKAISESEVCLFCHTPHRSTGEAPLWNHALSVASYTPYRSSTLKATVGQPNGASKLCLSCHDGTVALGMVHSRGVPIAMAGGVTTLPAGRRSNLGTDLSDDHPVSFTYDASLAARHGELRDPATLRNQVRLDHNGQMQCTACHDPHDNRYGKFLVRDNEASALCLECHAPARWQSSAHRTSTRTWNGTGVDPWPHSARHSVQANACENCHTSHAAGTPARLLTHANEEQNCFACHSGTVASKNIAAEFNKASVHPITASMGVHDPFEDILNPGTRHVECADCHNPHAAHGAAAVAPNAGGPLAGVAGITLNGARTDAVTKEYELCFRCHADSLRRGTARVPRQFPETNTRLEFSPASASHHPVVTGGRNPNVPSLIAPWTTSSLMYCTDCHNNNSLAGPRGPHGSIHVPLLERNLNLTDGLADQPSDLCYKCHDRGTLLNEGAGAYRPVSKLHIKHVKDKHMACTSCHDPHGVPTVTHLINFNVNYASPYNGRLEFRDTGTFSGNCTLRCHDKDHNALPYPQ